MSVALTDRQEAAVVDLHAATRRLVDLRKMIAALDLSSFTETILAEQIGRAIECVERATFRLVEDTEVL